MLLQLLEKRRSTRKFSDKPVEKEKVDALLEAALRSPSSKGSSPWHFIVIQDAGIIGKLAESKVHGSAFMKGAPLAIVVCADPEKSDVWIEDAAIASLIIHLASIDLDLGSCWVQIRTRPHDQSTASETYVKELLGISDNIHVEAMVAIGYPETGKPAHGRDSLLYDRIYYNHFGNNGK